MKTIKTIAIAVVCAVALMGNTSAGLWPSNCGEEYLVPPVVGAIYFVVGSIDADPPDLSAFATTSTIPADDDNAWCGFIAATNAVKRWVEPLAWDKLSSDELDALVAENAEAIAFFQNAARRTKWYDAATRDKGFFSNFFPCGVFIQMVKLYRAKAERQIARGEIRAAVESVDDLMTLSSTIQSDAETIVCWLVANGAQGMALSVAVQIIASGKASDEELRTLLGALCLTDVPMLRESVQRAVNNEFLYGFVDAQRIVVADMRSGWTSRLISGFAYHPNRTKKFYVKMANRAKELLSHDYDKRLWESFESEITAATPRRFIMLTPNHAGWQVLAALFPAYDALAKHLARGEFGLSAAKVVVAAELFRRKTGHRPKSLEALVPEFLPAVPADPFGCGASLKYDAERGVVWTVGPDGKFNGEKQPGKKSYGRNRGYVINLDGRKVE